jgi:hypothetical protein
MRQFSVQDIRSERWQGVYAGANEVTPMQSHPEEHLNQSPVALLETLAKS